MAPPIQRPRSRSSSPSRSEATTCIPIEELTPAYFRSLLAKLHLAATEQDDHTEMLHLLSRSLQFTAVFGSYDFSTLLLEMTDEEEVVNVLSADHNVRLYAVRSEFPCSVCNFAVNDTLDIKSGQGLECSGCSSWFHNHCTQEPLAASVLDCLSPNYVKLYCPCCMHNNIGNSVQSNSIVATNKQVDQIHSDLKDWLSSEMSIITSKSSDLLLAVQEQFQQVISKTVELAETMNAVKSSAVALTDRLDADTIDCGELKQKIDGACICVESLKGSWENSTTQFSSALETVVDKASKLDHFDFKALSATATKTINDISGTVNRCMLEPKVVEKMSESISECLSKKEILPKAMQQQLSDTIKEEVEKTNKKIDEMAEKAPAPSWAALATENREQWQIAGARGKAMRKNSSLSAPNPSYTGPSQQTKEMDVTKTISIGNAHQPELASSAKIKSAFNKCFPNMEITHCKRSMNGYVLVEVDTVENAKKVVAEWKSSTFFVDGNSKEKKETTAVLLEDARAKAVIMDVDKDLSDEDITRELRKDYAKSSARRFKNARGPTYSVLLTFNSKEDLLRAERSPISIFQMRFRIRPYTNRPRIIQCFKCNKFGHIAPTCRHERSCTFCTLQHTDEECMIKKDTRKEDYKCSNCGKNHTAFDRSCEAYQKMVQSVKDQS